MPVNPYDDRKVSLWRPHGNGDLDIVGASYTRRMANVTEVLETSSKNSVDQGQIALVEPTYVCLNAYITQ